MKHMNENKTKPIPDGYHTATPYLIVEDASKAIEFYKKAFGAKELMRLDMPGGRVAHAEIKIGNSPIMLGESCGEGKSPETLGGSPVSIMLYVENVDSSFPKAIAAGGKETKPVKDQFYGDRCGTLTDPFGHIWHVATHKEDLTQEEIKTRAAKLFQTATAAS